MQGYRHANQGFQRIEEQLCSQFEMQTEVGAVHFVVELVEMPALAVFPLSRVGRRKSYAPGITTECLQQFMGLGKARPGNAWPYVFFPTRIIIPNGFTASYAKYRPTFHNGYVRPVRHSRVHPSSPAMFICLLLNEWGRVVGKRSKFAATLKVIEYSPRSILNPFDQWNWGLVSFSTQAFFYQDCVLAKLTMLICSSTVNPKFIGKLPSGYLT